MPFLVQNGTWQVPGTNTPIANGSVTYTISVTATIVPGVAGYPGTITGGTVTTFNLDSNGNMPGGSLYGASELNPPGVYYLQKVYSGPNGTGTHYTAYDATVTIGPGSPYTGTLYPNIAVLPQITVNTNVIDGVIVTGIPTAGQAIVATGSAAADWQGVVQSVALAVPGILTVSGSPITSSGTITIGLANESANTFFAGPVSGGATTPTFRALALADFGSQSANTFLAGPVTGSPPSAFPTWRGIVNADLPSDVVTSVVNDTNVTGTISAQALTLGWTGTLAVARGGTGTSSPSLVAGSNISITGSWPNQTVALTTVTRAAAFSYVIDGGGAPPTTGPAGQISIPIACTVTGWVLTADQSGSAVVDVLRSSYSGFPGSLASIAGSDLPTLSSVQKNENLSVSSWTTAINAGDQIQFYVDSASTLTRLNVTINVTIP